LTYLWLWGILVVKSGVGKGEARKGSWNLQLCLEISQMNESMAMGIVVLFIIIVCFLPTIIVIKIERYITRCINGAEDEGFTFLERRYDGKGKRYKVVYDFMISSDRNTLVAIGAGTLATIPVSSMWFISKDVNGNGFTTVTNQIAVEYDLTGRHKDSLIVTSNFRKAFRHHLKCIEKKLYTVEPYIENGEIDVVRRLRTLDIDQLNTDGLIKYVGENTDYWKYTVKGAVKLAICQIIQGVIRAPMSLLNGLLKTKND